MGMKTYKHAARGKELIHRRNKDGRQGLRCSAYPVGDRIRIIILKRTVRGPSMQNMRFTRQMGFYGDEL